MFKEYSSKGIKAIVICTTQRTGSTMLCEQMRATGKLGNPGESLLAVGNMMRKGDGPRHLAYEHRFKKGLLNDVYALKLMYSYAAPVGQYLDADPDPLTSLHRIFAPATWVYLKRNDRLGQAISRFFNIRTSQSHKVETSGSSFMVTAKQISTDYNRHVAFDYPFLAQLRREIDKDNQGWEDFFARFSVQPVRLVYEEIVGQYEQLNQIAQASGIDLLVTAMPDTGLRPVRNQYSQLMRQLYEKVQAALPPEYSSISLLQATLNALDKVYPDKNDWYFYQIAMAQYQGKQHPQALESLEAGLATEPDFVEYYIKLAHLKALCRGGRHAAEASIAESRKLFAANPESLAQLDNYLFHTYCKRKQGNKVRQGDASFLQA